MPIFNQLTRLALALVAASLAMSCASSPSGEGAQSASRSTECIFGRTISNWRALDDENVILFASRRQPYLVELSRRAFGLSRDFRIGIYDRDGRICPFGGDAIIVDSVVQERIPIRSIRRLDEDQLQQIYIEYGITEPPDVEMQPVEIVDEAVDDEAQAGERDE